jgi:hypothetical protein
MQIADPVLARKQDQRRMLEDHRQRDHRRLTARQQQRAGADALLRPAADHLRHHLGGRRGLHQLHVQPGLAVIALLERGVIAGELELVALLELQRHPLQGLGGPGGDEQQQQQQGGGAQQHGWPWS